MSPDSLPVPEPPPNTQILVLEDSPERFQCRYFGGILLAFSRPYVSRTRIDVLVTPEFVATAVTRHKKVTCCQSTFDEETTLDLEDISDPEGGPGWRVRVDGRDCVLSFGGRELGCEDVRWLFQRVQRITGLPNAETLRQRMTEQVEESPPLPGRTELQILEDSESRLRIKIPSGGPAELELRYISATGILLMLIVSAWCVLFNAEVIIALTAGWVIMLLVSIGWAYSRFEDCRLNLLAGEFSIHETFFGHTDTVHTRVDSPWNVVLVHPSRGGMRFKVFVAGVDKRIDITRATTLSERDQRYLVRKLRYAIQQQLSQTIFEQPIPSRSNEAES